MKKVLIMLVLISAVSCNPFTPINGLFNKIDYELEKQNDSQRYERRKQVEDTARSMIASYESDKQTYLSMKEVNKEVSQISILIICLLISQAYISLMR